VVTEPSHAILLSYASQDAEAAQRICEALRDAGTEVWLDQSELRGGDAWDESIRDQIKACALFIPVISANAHARVEGYFRLEWKLAVDRSHRMAPKQPFLLPMVIDDTPQSDDAIPDRLSLMCRPRPRRRRVRRPVLHRQSESRSVHPGGRSQRPSQSSQCSPWRWRISSQTGSGSPSTSRREFAPPTTTPSISRNAPG